VCLIPNALGKINPYSFSMHSEFTLIRDLAIIMAVAGVALVLFRHLKQPPILGYLLAGLIIGPFTLPNPPVGDVETIRRLADIGLVLLLFAAGLEFGWDRIRRLGMVILFVGLFEISFMIIIGYNLGILLGWTSTEAFFLGSALAVSSSAILLKLLRDTNSLLKPHGQLIVGILIIEDFAAVILLAILSGLASTGSATLGDIGSILLKLSIFTVSSLVLGAIFAPRILKFISKTNSKESLLISALAICFGLALVGQELGISAALGSFLIGMVLGDTPNSKEIEEVMYPVRDMFAAIFFVSIGMLVDLSLVKEFIGPALLVTMVFIFGKIAAGTIGSFVVGNTGKTSLEVGTSMPQTGEFSLAMAKVGSDFGAIGTSLYPVVAVTTAITSFLYPYISKSSDLLSRIFRAYSPSIVKKHAGNATNVLSGMQTMVSVQLTKTQLLQRLGKLFIINLTIAILVITLGTFSLEFSPIIGHLLPGTQELWGSTLGMITLIVAIPPGFVMWKYLRQFALELPNQLVGNRAEHKSNNHHKINIVLGWSIFIGMNFVLVFISVPFISKLLFIGGLSIPISLAILTGSFIIASKISLGIHHVLESAFHKTFLGQIE